MNLVIEKGGKPVGTISHRRDGDYKKISDGVWERITEPKQQQQENESGEEKVQKYKPYSCKGFKVKEEVIDEAVKEANGFETRGKHWGNSNSLNAYAKMVAFSSAQEFRPTNKIKNGQLKAIEFELDKYEIEEAVQMRNYAQNRIKKVSREEHPEVYRGMSMTEEQLNSIMSGETKKIELTGATAFTFKKKVMDEYADSEWTESFGKDKKAVKIILKRNDKVDDSIGMWHDDRNNEDKPAFELVSGLSFVEVIEKKVIDDAWKQNKIKELYNQYSGDVLKWGDMINKIGTEKFDDVLNILHVVEGGIDGSIKRNNEIIVELENKVKNYKENPQTDSKLLNEALNELNRRKEIKEIFENYKPLLEKYGNIGTFSLFDPSRENKREEFRNKYFKMADKIKEYKNMVNAHIFYCEAK